MLVISSNGSVSSFVLAILFNQLSQQILGGTSFQQYSFVCQLPLLFYQLNPCSKPTKYDYLFNARSICNKLPELHRLLSLNPFIVLVRESGCNPYSINNSVLTGGRSNDVYRCRESHVVGGVLALVPNGLPLDEVLFVNFSPCCHLLALILNLAPRTFLILVYRSTSCEQEGLRLTRIRNVWGVKFQ